MATVTINGLEFDLDTLSDDAKAQLGMMQVVDATGGGRSSAIIRKISANRFFKTATSAIWNATKRAWPTTSAPILINFSRSVVIGESLIGSGVANVRVRLEADGIGGEQLTGKSRPFDRALALDRSSNFDEISVY